MAAAGPLVGTIAAFAIYIYADQTDSRLWLAVAYSGFFLNLFNLIPISPLDGGRIAPVLSPRVWFLGVPLLVGAFVYIPSPILILLAILAIPQLIAAWNYDPLVPENRAYYGIPASAKSEYAILYFVLAAALGIMTYLVHQRLHSIG